MSNERISVGFIGLNPDSHWASMAHMPALASLSEDFAVVGVANSTPESGQRTAKAFNLPHAFDTPQQLVASDAIDLVVVTVKVPYHFELVSAALEAGKNVHCEWPLGNGLEEARKLAQAAREKGVVATVGTQMRVAPEVQYLKKLIADGYVGKVLSTTLVGDGWNWGDETIADLTYLFDNANGASMLTIPFGQTMAGFREVLGEFTEVSGRLVTLRDSVRVTDTGENIVPTAADQILVHGVLESGATVSAHYRGGLSRATGLLWEINGTEGDIQVTGAMGHGQIAQLSLYGGRGEATELEPLAVPAELYEGKSEETIPRNVSGIYARIARDIRTGSHTAPSFDDAVRLHELLDAIERSDRNAAATTTVR